MLLSIQQAAALLGVCDRTIYRRIDDGTLPVVRLGPTQRINSEAARDVFGSDISIENRLQLLRGRGVRV